MLTTDWQRTGWHRQEVRERIGKDTRLKKSVLPNRPISKHLFRSKKAVGIHHISLLMLEGKLY